MAVSETWEDNTNTHLLQVLSDLLDEFRSVSFPE